MALLNCLKFKMGNRRRSKRVDADKTAPPADSSPDQCSTDPSEKHKDTPLEATYNSVVMIKRYSWPEIQRIGGNFSRVIGEGGFSTVYLAHLSDDHTSTLAALKIHRKSSSERLCRLFNQELEILLQIRHQNIVNLLGYCDEQEEGALVLEYVPNGSLHEKLHDDDMNKTLPWKNRMWIAFQLAQAIDYLHSDCALQIVHGDIKSSNVLLDEHLNCRLCDFGSAKMGFSSSMTTMTPRRPLILAGSPGYMDPHYLRTGIASKKNDVYSFGVILLELITGMEAFCSHNQKLLTSTVGAILKNDDFHDQVAVSEMVDPRLAAAPGDFQREELVLMTSLAAQCIRPHPTSRPSMADIVGIMRQKISTISHHL